MCHNLTSLFFIYYFIFNRLVNIAYWLFFGKLIIFQFFLTISMSDTNDMSDYTDYWSAFFEGSISNEGSAATMATLTPEPNPGVDDAGNNP
jgi:hypothetical protein